MANEIFDTPAGTARSEDHLPPLHAVEAEAEDVPAERENISEAMKINRLKYCTTFYTRLWT